MSKQDEIREKNPPSTKYHALHKWLYSKYGKANKCENSSDHKSTKYEWANLSGKYLREIKDWKQLCPSCHRKMDYTDELKEKIRKSMYGTHRAFKPVYQYSASGEFIKKWESAVVAGNELKISISSIHGVTYGHHQKAGGFIWSK